MGLNECYHCEREGVGVNVNLMKNLTNSCGIFRSLPLSRFHFSRDVVRILTTIFEVTKGREEREKKGYHPRILSIEGHFADWSHVVPEGIQNFHAVGGLIFNYSQCGTKSLSYFLHIYRKFDGY